MTTLAIINQIGGWWDELSTAKQMFYGIGVVATVVTVVLAIMAAIGMDNHDADAGGFDHGGVGAFSLKPLTGFFLAFGWVGGIALDHGFSLFVAIICAFAAGSAVMVGIIALYRAMLTLRSDGTMDVNQAVGAIGTVYVTLPPGKAAGGQVVVNFSGRQETFAALNGTARAIASGEKVKVISIIDGRTVLVEAL